LLILALPRHVPRVGSQAPVRTLPHYLLQRLKGFLISPDL